jgi:tetratricopeptide (TPR) repeat protein
MFLTIDGRPTDAIHQATLACELDPLSAVIHGVGALVHCILGRFDTAQRMANYAVELQPDYLLGLWTRGLALSGLGRHEEAIDSLERVAALSHAPFFVGLLACAYGRAGRIEDAQRLLGDLEDRHTGGEDIHAFAGLAIYVGIGDVGGIRGALSKVLQEATATRLIYLLNAAERRVQCGATVSDRPGAEFQCPKLPSLKLTLTLVGATTSPWTEEYHHSSPR